MFRRISLVAALALLLIPASGWPTAAQSGYAPKEIRFVFTLLWECTEPPCELETVLVNWLEPEQKPDSYRVNWTTTDRWRKNNRPNNRKAGNAIVTSDSYRITGLKVPWGEALRIRVRARYDGERNGPWYCCLTAGYGRGGWVMRRAG